MYGPQSKTKDNMYRTSRNAFVPFLLYMIRLTFGRNPNHTMEVSSFAFCIHSVPQHMVLIKIYIVHYAQWCFIFVRVFFFARLFLSWVFFSFFLRLHEMKWNVISWRREKKRRRRRRKKEINVKQHLLGGWIFVTLVYFLT